MATANDVQVIAIEEHYNDSELTALFEGRDARSAPHIVSRLDELERCVDKLGFKGAMIHGLTNGGLFFDDKRFWPIFERAEALDVPLYMHPAIPHPDVIKAYYEDYLDDFPGLLTAGWGFTVETATQGIRLVISGVFDAHPGVERMEGLSLSGEDKVKILNGNAKRLLGM